MVLTLIPPSCQPPEDTYKPEAEAFPKNTIFSNINIIPKFDLNVKLKQSHDKVEMQQACLQGTSMSDFDKADFAWSLSTTNVNWVVESTLIR